MKRKARSYSLMNSTELDVFVRESTEPQDVEDGSVVHGIEGFREVQVHIGGQMGVNFFKSLHRFTVVYT
jgi:hypothetical protein